MPSFDCPTCRKTFDAPRREDAPFRPFCSKRCKLLDLYKWFAGEYKISDPLPSSGAASQLPDVPDPDEPD